MNYSRSFSIVFKLVFCLIINILPFSSTLLAQSPGKLGTTNLTAWFKPDSLTSGNVVDWLSSFPNGANAITFRDTSGAPYPQATDTSNGVLNYNKVISFAGNSASNVLSLGKLGTVNLLNNNTSTGASTVVMVYYLPSYTATGGHFIHYRESGGDGIQFRHLGTVTRCAIGTTNSVNGTRDYNEDYKPMLFSYTGNKSGAATMSVFKRAKIQTTSIASATTGDNGVIIGARLNASAWAGFYEGYIGEFMFYNSTLNVTDLNKVHSYLALKYGITLDSTGGGTQGDYVAPNGTLLWDASVNPKYHNNVIGIGREDAEAFDHRQSHSLDDSIRLYVGYLATTNLANFSPITNDSSYVLIGSDMGQLASNTAANAEMPSSGVYSRIEREWKIKPTNFIDNFSVDIKLNATANLTAINSSDLILLVDEDGDFSNATIYNYLSGINFSYSNGVVAISNLNYAQFPIDSIRYFTIGSSNSNSPLPVKFVSLNAQKFDNFVQVSWATALENNNDYFSVERNNNNSWENIGYVKSKGNSNKITQYSFIDNQAPKSILYYRIKQTDFDGKFSFSNKAMVNLSEPNYSDFKAFPSLVQNEIQVNVNISKIEKFQLVNTLGQDFTQSVTLSQNDDDLSTIDVSKLASGGYYIITNQGKAFFYKM